MKKLNITKEQFNRSRYFQKKYGTLEYVSESGKVFKTNKGKVIVFKESTNGYLGIPGTKYSPKRGVVEYQGFTFTEGEIWKLARDFLVEEYGLAPINVKDLEKWLHEDDENMDMMLNLLDDASIEKKYGKDYFKENRKTPRTNKGKVLMFKEDSQGLRNDEKKKWTWWGSSDDATYNDAPSSDYEQGDIDWCPEGGWEDREDAWYSMLAIVTDIISKETTGVDLRNDVYDDVKQGHRSVELDIDHDAGTVEANINGDHYEWWLAEEQ